MKRIHLAGFLMLFLLALPAFADRTNLIADISFPFYAGNELMDPGQYTLTQPHDQLTATMVRFVDQPKAVIVANYGTTSRDPSTKGAYLVFNKYPDGRHFLAQAWMPGAALGTQIVRSRKEKESVSSRLVTQARPTRVIVLAKVR
ncbi:MAG: hypothetical protein HUU38_08295 [Anaerolineales bacterium]|nr:hypothetical protein [Anaerolineales bacterium]